MARRLKQILIALDQLANTLAGGTADETLSARAYRMEIEGHRTWPRRLIDRLFWFDPMHCRDSYYAELQRRHMPAHYRQETAPCN